jgi:hypothetical protein
MNPILSILRAAHCRSTHHYFAVDALPLVETDAGGRLTKILLRHHGRYLTGAKDPDTRFRDFQNHVVHVNDGYWGGAPRVAHQWYDRLQKYLRQQRWKDAAHAAGVLSHYFTDPIMPLHTQQSAREKILHRPIEWSVTKSYRSIMKLWDRDEMRIVFDMSDQPGWLGEAILHGARHANRFYFPLMDTYDLGRGRRKPTEGLSLIAKQALAELFGLAVTGWARVIERAAADAESTIGQPLPSPSVPLGIILATARVPMRLWIRNLDHARERSSVEALIDEFQRTGELKRNLPDEVDIVHRVIKVRADEIAWKQRRKQLQSTETEITIEKPIQEVEQPREPEPVVLPFPIKKEASIATRPRADVHFGLRLQDPLVDAPSIGPRTADRFTAIGIHSVHHFLKADPGVMSDDLATRWINESIITLWQTQAKVMCEVPGLNCRDSQMLAGAGFGSRQSVAEADVEELHAAVTRYATTSAGKRYLRGAMPPTPGETAHWIENAQAVDAPVRRAA